MAKTLRVGRIGYRFMGKAHSNAWRQAPRFFKLKANLEPHTICGARAIWLATRRHRLAGGGRVAADRHCGHRDADAFSRGYGHRGGEKRKACAVRIAFGNESQAG